MASFNQYVQRLEDLVLAGAKPDRRWSEQCAKALDGEPDRELQKSLALSTRRRLGAFFTGSALACKTVAQNAVQDLPVVFDPACGAGDLLIAASESLPVCDTLTTTIALWERRLTGCDIRPDFVRMAKARLILQALVKGATVDCNLASIHGRAFPLITVADGLQASLRFRTATWIVMNPPFGTQPAPVGCSWASGKITAAAQFLETAVRQSKKGTQITAILPDVIRSGSRYAALWDEIGPWVDVNRRRTLGLFATADVHVYLTNLIVRAEPRRTAPKRQSISGTVADKFDVHVGPVVPFRHAKVGLEYPYLHAKELPKWCSVRKIPERRRFSGTTFVPPFLVVRRTSRPEDSHRATATLITAPTKVAVENHLIVCLPKDGTVKSCRLLLSHLKTTRINEWLNRRIRCRHLTVEAVREIPFE